MATSSSSSSKTSTSHDIVSNLSNFLPTGTFLAFQSIAPLFTNNGHCGHVEKIMTGILILTFSIITFTLSFTDSISTVSGKHYYGLVTCKGLYNPQFKGSNIANVSGSVYTGEPARYKVSIFDFINAVLAVVVLSVLILLTPPVSTCYYPKLSSTIIKTVPILVGIIAGLYFSFAPPPRRGVGYSLAGLVNEPVGDKDAAVPDGAARQSLLLPAEKAADSASSSPSRPTV